MSGRSPNPTPVTREERDQEEERVLDGMRWLDPTCNGRAPPSLSRKATLLRILTGADGADLGPRTGGV